MMKDVGKMKPMITIASFCLLTSLVGCNQQADQGAQPQIGTNSGQVIDVSDRRNMESQENTFDQPYTHNYQGSYSGAQDANYSDELRSAQQVAARATEAARTVTGVEKATAVAQGMDIVIAVDTVDRGGNRRAVEEQVRKVVSSHEDGYNVYVSTDADINERILRLFSNMNNVKTSFVTHGISEIVYQIGLENGQNR